MRVHIQRALWRAIQDSAFCLSVSTEVIQSSPKGEVKEKRRARRLAAFVACVIGCDPAAYFLTFGALPVPDSGIT
ncbi:MAG: hypothetical protein WCD12_22425, partial [Candidatus Binatus sp.]